MLVLSRKKEQKILFPSLGVTLEILRISGNTVSVGIRAPRAIQILRDELCSDIERCSPKSNETGSSPTEGQSGTSKLSHEMRNRLNSIFLSISVVQKLLNQGMVSEAEARLTSTFDELSQLDQGIEIDPQRSPASNPDQREPVQPSQNTGCESDATGMTTLLVEDDLNERALLAGYLSMCGYRVLTAQDGLEALKVLGRQPVDLVVLDMRMPRMNGAETLRAIRKDPFLKDLRVVVVSGEEQPESMKGRDSRGVSEWFTKPLDPARLVKHLAESQN